MKMFRNSRKISAATLEAEWARIEPGRCPVRERRATAYRTGLDPVSMRIHRASW